MTADNTGVERSRPATIHQVAALAGVSHQTVSRFLKKDSGMRPETVQRVSDAMAELHYTPNLAARSLRSRRQDRIVLVSPVSTLYFPTRLFEGAVRSAQERGFRVDVVPLEGTAEEQADGLEVLLTAGDLAGVLAFAPLPEGTGVDSPLAAGVPIFVAEGYDEKMRTRGGLADGTPSARIVQALHALGHTEFFHIGGPGDWSSARNRRTEYERAIAELGLTSHGVAEGDWSADSGYRLCSEVLACPEVTAVVVANDQMAYGVLRRLNENGVAVPQQMSVTGWDDMPWSRYSVPSLSSVRMDLESQGASAMEGLISLIRGESKGDPKPPVAAMEIVMRESVAAAPSRNSGK